MFVPTQQDDPNLTIRGEYDPADFTTADYNLSSRTKTTAGVSWERVQYRRGGLQAVARYIAVIQEIVDTEVGAAATIWPFPDRQWRGRRFASLPRWNTPLPTRPPQLVVEWTIAATGNEIDAVTGSGAATLATHGAADVTLGAITGAAVGGVISGAAGAATLDAITGTAAATC
jgi:hypothetical protein